MYRPEKDDGFPTKSDVIRLARQCGYPMDNQLHVFIVKLCETCNWDSTQVFRAIFNETLYHELKDIVQQ